jgi:glutaconate CoA-transferase subunit B
MRTCTLGEAFVYNIARTVENGTLVFHGYGSPLVQLALHLAKRTHAPDLVLVAGATYGVNPRPPFLTPTSNDWALDRASETSLDIAELFDLAASGRMARMFLSGAQIDRHGSCNVTRLGAERVAVKLPGGGGGCNLSCDVEHVTLWTAAHRSLPQKDGKRRFRLVERCDFVTNLGHCDAEGRPRAALGHRGKGPDWLVTDLGIFDFDAGELRVRALYPDVALDEVRASTGFDLQVAPELEPMPLPDAEAVEIVRALDPLGVHLKELQPGDRERRFTMDGCPSPLSTTPTWSTP